MPLVTYRLAGKPFQRKTGPRRGWWIQRYRIDGSVRAASWQKPPTRAQIDAEGERLRSSQSLPATSGESIAVYLDRWLRDGLPDAKDRTIRGYRTIVEGRLVPELGRVALSALQPAAVQRFVNRVSASGAAPRTVVHVLACLRAAMSQAVRWGLLDRNPCDHIKSPRIPHSEPQILSPEQTRALLVQVKGDPLEALYVLAAMTGMRQGEILGLRWSAVNLTAGTLSVERTLWWEPDPEAKAAGRKITRKPTLVDPKTERSRRTIHLPARVVTALTDHRKREMQTRKEVDAGLVFCRPTGTALEPGAAYRGLRRHLAAAKLPIVRFHDLRHGMASLHLADGMPVSQVSELLGHANASVTLNIYGHVLENARRETAERTERLLGEGVG